MLLDIDKIEKQQDYEAAVYNMIHKFIYNKLFSFYPYIPIIGYFDTSRGLEMFSVPFKFKSRLYMMTWIDLLKHCGI